MCVGGGGGRRVVAGGDIDPEVILESRRETREAVLKNREGNGTDRMYGDRDGTRGLTKHFRKYCEAEAGDTVYGVVMPAKKVAYTGAAHPTTVELFLKQFVLKRPRLDSRGNIIPGTEGTLGVESVKAYIKALSDLYVDHQKDPRYMEELEGTDKPRTYGEVSRSMCVFDVPSDPRALVCAGASLLFAFPPFSSRRLCSSRRLAISPCVPRR